MTPLRSLRVSALTWLGLAVIVGIPTARPVGATPDSAASGQIIEDTTWSPAEQAHATATQREHPAIAAAVAGRRLYFGDLHNHTAFSIDADGTPADAFPTGRDGGLDVMAITDHSEWLNDGEWDRTAALAEAATDAGFLAIRGFEWSSIVNGHVNVWDSAHYTDILRTPGTVSMRPFWRWLTGRGADGLAGFNHPGREPGRFDQFAYDADADGQMVSLEVFNRGDTYAEGYVAALDAGWHVGAVGVSDHHGSTWGDPAYPRTGLYATELTLDGIRAALAARHVYATQDSDLQLAVTAHPTDRPRRDGELAGSVVRTTADTLPLRVVVADPTDPVATIELLSTGAPTGRVLATARPTPDGAGGTVTRWHVDVPVPATGSAWYVVRVTQTDGQQAYASPVWVQH